MLQRSGRRDAPTRSRNCRLAVDGSRGDSVIGTCGAG